VSIPAYKREFLRFMIEAKVLRFGQFRTKSGRETPYFINSGGYDDGRKLRRLGEFYAEALVANLGSAFDLLYGPAYKGIPLVATTAAALDARHGRAVPYVFNRKEAKDHGEGGLLIGRTPQAGDRVVIVDDVITAGTSVTESLDLLHRTCGVRPSALVVSVDRQERGTASPQSALQMVRDTYGLTAFAIVTLADILDFVRAEAEGGSGELTADLLARIEAYRGRYGVAE
jgi:orotate phosphoribosyltransferase